MSANLIVLIHFAFILFVIFGGLLATKWRKLIYLHIPTVIWGACIEFSGWICPLTPLENQFRLDNNEKTYSTGFIEHYIVPLIYPEGLTRDIQFILGLAVLFFNLFVYYWYFKKRKNPSAD